MLVNDECSFWYRKILLSFWDRRKEVLYGNGSAYNVGQINPTAECKYNGTECYGG